MIIKKYAYIYIARQQTKLQLKKKSCSKKSTNVFKKIFFLKQPCYKKKKLRNTKQRCPTIISFFWMDYTLLSAPFLFRDDL